MIKLPNNDEIVDDEEKNMKGDVTLNETGSKSPQKSLAITKGPQWVIPQTLELDSYKAVEVKEI